jgi:hypothetical protein
MMLQMSELDAMLARVMPYAGCQLITRLVEATNEPLCVQYLSGDFLLGTLSNHPQPHQQTLAYPAPAVLSAVGICVIWLFYQFVLVLAYERYRLHAPTYTRWSGTS